MKTMLMLKPTRIVPALLAVCMIGLAPTAALAARHNDARVSRDRTQVNNTHVDSRTRNVRNTSVNNVNVNVNRSVNVDNHGGWDNDHPVATAAAVTATVAVTAAVVGSVVHSVPANCMPVNYGGLVYQQCGSSWYRPQGTQYVVVNPPY